MSVKGCIFCGVDLTDLPGREAADRSNDPPVPRWLQEKLGIEKDMIRQGEVGRAGTLTPQREHAVAGFRTGRVCKTRCNGGWMSGMERNMTNGYPGRVSGRAPG